MFGGDAELGKVLGLEFFALVFLFFGDVVVDRVSVFFDREAGVVVHSDGDDVRAEDFFFGGGELLDVLVLQSFFGGETAVGIEDEELLKEVQGEVAGTGEEAAKALLLGDVNGT